MSDLPVAKRRRVAPEVGDPMAPPAPAAVLPMHDRPTATVPMSAAPTVPAKRAGGRRAEPTVQLATRIQPVSDAQLRDLAAARGCTIRQVIEDLVMEAWRREVGTR